MQDPILQQISHAMALRDSSQFGKETWKDATTILTYELGMVIHHLFYADCFPAEALEWRAYAKSEMMDLICQAEVLCLRMGWSFAELRELGAEKFEERMLEICHPK